MKAGIIQLLSIILFVVHLSSMSVAAPLANHAKIYELMRDLNRPESPSSDASPNALSKLKAVPREQILAAARSGLKDDALAPAVLQAVQALSLSELLPELRQTLLVSDDWRTVLTVTALSTSETDRKATAALYLQKLAKKNSVTFITSALSGLAEFRVKVPVPTLKTFMGDTRFDVQSSAIDYFLEVRNSYRPGEQKEIFSQAFKVASQNGRKSALMSYGQLTQVEKKATGDILTAKVCGAEADSDVRKVCEQALGTKGKAK